MGTFHEGQVVTVFRNRLDPAAGDRYSPHAAEMVSLARSMPGFVDAKTFVADDGERVTIATFEDAESQRAWREHADHRRAQEAGRDSYYLEYSLQVCETTKVRAFRRAGSNPRH